MSFNRPHLVLYSHDTYGLGHLRRNLTISQRLDEDFPQISQLLVTGSSHVHQYPLPRQVDYIKLPAIEKRARGDYRSKILDVEGEAIRRWRAEMILQAVREFEPDILMVDKAPAGVYGELRPTLEFLKRERPATWLVFGMRDIIDAPSATRAEWTREGVYELLEETYDTILLYGSRAFFDPISEYQLSHRIASKFAECGHIGRLGPRRSKAEVLEELKPGDKPLLVVTPGGGGDGAELLQIALDMLTEETSNVRRRFHSVIVTGPLMSGEERARFKSYARQAPGLTIVEFTPDMLSYLNAADIVVSMGGYNTVCELLSLKQRAVIVPRVNVRSEQLIRAKRLAERGQARLIHPSELTPARLLAEINLALDAPRPDPERAGIDLNGLERISSTLGRLLDIDRLHPAERGDRIPVSRIDH